MPAMIRAPGKATKIAEQLLGLPKKKKKKVTKQEKRLVFEETRLIR